MMKGYINNNGFLIIYRKNKDRGLYCPYTYDYDIWCGDWCPLFGEPEKEERSGSPYGQKIEITKLSLCKKILEFTEFKDEREEV